MKGSGFYGSKNHHDVFVFDAKSGRSVWIVMGMFDVVSSDPQVQWVLPRSNEEVTRWLDRYGFEKMTAEQAAEATSQFAWGLRELVEAEEI